jgi:hypothetical protein
LNACMYICCIYMLAMHACHVSWIATLLVASNIRRQARGEGVADSQTLITRILAYRRSIM